MKIAGMLFEHVFKTRLLIEELCFVQLFEELSNFILIVAYCTSESPGLQVYINIDRYISNY